MKITKIWTSRKINLGNYENKDIGAEAIIEEGDNAEECFVELDDLLLREEARVKAK